MAVNYLLQFGSGDPRTLTGLAPTFLIFKDKDGNNVTAPGITEIPSSTGLYYFAWGTTTNIAFLADAATTSPGSAGRYIAGMLDASDRISEFGTSLMSYGNTLVALGTTNFALGTTNVALGTTNVALGTTNVALGTTGVALGITNVALGTTNVALGNTAVALGISNFAFGGSNIALGTTNVALGTTITSLLNGLSSPLILAIGTTASLTGDDSTSPVTLFGYLKRIRELHEGNQSFVKSTGVQTQFDRTGATTLYSKTITNNASLVTKT